MTGAEGNNFVGWEEWEIVGSTESDSSGSIFEVERATGHAGEKAVIKKISIPQNYSDIEDMRNDGCDDEMITGIFDARMKEIRAEYDIVREMRSCVNIVGYDDIKCERQSNGMGWDIYIRMEPLTPLTKLLDENTWNDTERMVNFLAKDMCNAINTCKKHNVIHGDINPQNIFVTADGDFRLGGFGAAKVMGKAIGGTKIGTYKYMAPEAYNDQRYEHSSDIYSLGLVLYWILNEQRMPFMPLPPEKIKVNSEEESNIRRFAGKPLPAPVNGSDKLKRVVLKACAYHPKDRYKSVDEMLMDIEEKYVVTGDAKDPLPQPNFLEKLKIKANELVNRFKSKKSKKEKGENKRTKILNVIEIVVTIVIILVALLSEYGWPFNWPNTDGETTTFIEQTTINEETSSDINGNDLNGDGVESTEDEGYTEEVNSVPVEHLYWSEWIDELPQGINKNGYDVEERTLYSSREQKTTSSTESNKMDGWELFDVVEAGSGYGAWSDWTDNTIDEIAGRQVESYTFYRYRDMETTTSYLSSLSGWTHYDTKYYWGDYGSWSDWSTTAVSSTDSRKVETKKQYRYRDISYSTQYTDWSNWSNWDFTRQNTNDLKKEESRTVWGYYYFKCPRCGAHMHGYGNGACYTWAGGCGGNIPVEGWNQFFFPYSWDTVGLRNWHGTGKYYVVIDGQRYFKWNDNGQPRPQYRYSTRTTKQVAKYGNWSNWSDSVYSNSSTREVEIRTVYRYCTRSQYAVYCYYRWGNWSNWLANSISETSTRQVESKKFYRYRDQIKTKTYYFKKWTDWTEFSTGVVTSSETVQVQTKTQYRFKAKTR